MALFIKIRSSSLLGGTIRGHNLALIADYLVREHAETVGETTNN